MFWASRDMNPLRGTVITVLNVRVTSAVDWNLPAVLSSGPASIGIWNCAAPSTNSSLQPSSRSSAWSRNGRLRKAGTFFAHLTDMKSSRAAASQIVSGELKYDCVNSCGYCNGKTLTFYTAITQGEINVTVQTHPFNKNYAEILQLNQSGKYWSFFLKLKYLCIHFVSWSVCVSVSVCLDQILEVVIPLAWVAGGLHWGR